MCIFLVCKEIIKLFKLIVTCEMYARQIQSNIQLILCSTVSDLSDFISMYTMQVAKLNDSREHRPNICKFLYQQLGRLLGITNQNPGVSKSNQVHVVINLEVYSKDPLE